MTAAPTPRPEASPWAFAGMVGMAGAFFLLAATPTILDAPWWVTALLLAAWAVALYFACSWFVRRPRAVVVLPLVLAVCWFAVVLLGARFLDWA
ncbi:hypothetical protein DDE18_14140 [Nocardioides gansuensis]|uniref:DUF4175 domain-containing protein n=1 Tax=Nocardioides gansuensis TaxID=2138300 RepID=A0A2T8F811_9ACTN|nr:hypothetical protein [Nocardioides gansuensis]PVG81858.1 hypothetical protein DDE18_14140 [Nocardioides gansuensis]